MNSNPPPPPPPAGAHRPAGSRLSGRVGAPNLDCPDARDRIELLAQARVTEEEDSTGPVCFGPRIQNEPFPDKFSLPRDTPKYDSSMKPEDWFTDYAMAVGIAHGNKRTTVRYVPLMLTGSARTWLNSLAPNSINAWPDFEKVFVRNFNGTYK